MDKERNVRKRFYCAIFAILVFGLVLFIIPTDKFIRYIITPDIQRKYDTNISIKQRSNDKEDDLPLTKISSEEIITNFSKGVKYSLNSLIFIIISCVFLRKYLKKDNFEYDATRIIQIISLITVLFAVFSFYNVTNSKKQYYIDKQSLYKGNRYITVEENISISNFLTSNHQEDKWKYIVFKNISSINEKIDIITILLGVYLVPLNYYQSKHDGKKNQINKKNH